MDLDEFIRIRRPHWNRLEQLLDVAEQSPEWELGRERLQELVRLYRLASSDLNHARSFTANPQVLDRLNALAGRGYRFVYRGTRRKTTRQAVKRFFVNDVPAAFRKESSYVLVAGAAMLLGALVGFAATIIDPVTAQDLTPAQFYNESPKERVDRIENMDERFGNIDEAAQFGAMLYTNNIQVSFLAFALGAFTIVGGVWYLFWSGTWLGAIAAMYYLDGVHVFFAAWVGPHGALELPAIVFAGAAGLRTGRALLLPGDLSRAASLRAAFPSIWRMMLGTAAVLVVAGLIEGSFSQFSAKTVPYGLKIGVAIALFVMLLVYLFVKRRSTSGEADA